MKKIINQIRIKSICKFYTNVTRNRATTIRAIKTAVKTVPTSRVVKHDSV